MANGWVKWEDCWEWSILLGYYLVTLTLLVNDRASLSASHKFLHRSQRSSSDGCDGNLRYEVARKARAISLWANENAGRGWPVSWVIKIIVLMKTTLTDAKCLPLSLLTSCVVRSWKHRTGGEDDDHEHVHSELKQITFAMWDHKVPSTTYILTDYSFLFSGSRP